MHGLGWVVLRWVVKLQQRFVGWVALGHALTSCADWQRE